MLSLPFHLIVLMLFSALSFLFFGFSCLLAPFMVLEFERYGLQQYRVLNGYLQLIGALALLAGLFYLPLGLLGSFGLSILMFLGLGVRIRIKDNLIKSLPALFYALLNVIIFFGLLQNHNV